MYLHHSFIAQTIETHTQKHIFRMTVKLYFDDYFASFQFTSLSVYHPNVSMLRYEINMVTFDRHSQR